MWPRGRPRYGWAPDWLDAAIAVPLTVFAQAELVLNHRNEPVAVGLSLLITCPLLWRSRAPVAVAIVAVGTFGLQAAVLDPAPQVMANGLAVLVAVYSAFALAGPRAATPVLLLAGFAFAVFEADQGTEPGTLGDLFATVAVAAIGWFVWRRHHQIDDQLAAAGAELYLAGLQADEALAEERRRIARELHDVVSHAVTVVVLQARGGRSMLSRDPEQTREALDAIEMSGQDALAEMRRLVTLLRGPTLDTAPQPGIADLSSLVTAATASGAQVALTIHGDAVPLSPGAELTAYRLVQEALTNALNHAPGTPVRVDIDYGTSTLGLRVSNPIPGAAQSPGGGYGLFGMRERVELYGGSLTYGPQAGEWLVRGTLPIAGSPPALGTAQPAPATRISLP
jgi:signal transduction histidine kinase